MDWVNACHIDTPVVSPVGPQEHNASGPRADLLCVCVPSAANSVTY